MKKIKNKSRKSISKRVKVTGSNKLKRHSAYTSHLALNKTTKQKKNLSKSKLVSSSDRKRWKKAFF